MQILLTNDDGIYAPGIAALKHQIQTLGQITVVAPDILYSGTVAAAVEAAIMGFPSIAVSFEITDQYADVAEAAKVARGVIERIIKHKLPKGSLLNVNIPSRPSNQIKGIKITRQFAHDFKETFDKRIDPGGRVYYWLMGTNKSIHREEGTDLTAVNEGYISITPLRYDLTDHALYKKIEEWDWSDLRIF